MTKTEKNMIIEQFDLVRCEIDNEEWERARLAAIKLTQFIVAATK